MKRLDRTKKYDLSKLTDEQYIAIINSLDDSYPTKRFKQMYFGLCWCLANDLTSELTCATELFIEGKSETLERILNKNETTLSQDIEILKRKALMQGLTLKIEIL